MFRTAISIAIQSYFSANLNYGKYDVVHIEPKQIKIGEQTVDISVTLKKQDAKDEHLYFPVKTRETQGGGHAHLFSRDLIVAVNDIKEHEPNAIIGVFIVAENWSISDLNSVRKSIREIFCYDMNPNELVSVPDKEQIKINRFIKQVLDND